MHSTLPRLCNVVVVSEGRYSLHWPLPSLELLFISGQVYPRRKKKIWLVDLEETRRPKNRWTYLVTNSRLNVFPINHIMVFSPSRVSIWNSTERKKERNQSKDSNLPSTILLNTMKNFVKFIWFYPFKKYISVISFHLFS